MKTATLVKFASFSTTFLLLTACGGGSSSGDNSGGNASAPTPPIALARTGQEIVIPHASNSVLVGGEGAYSHGSSADSLILATNVYTPDLNVVDLNTPSYIDVANDSVVSIPNLPNRPYGDHDIIDVSDSGSRFLIQTAALTGSGASRDFFVYDRSTNTYTDLRLDLLNSPTARLSPNGQVVIYTQETVVNSSTTRADLYRVNLGSPGLPQGSIFASVNNLTFGVGPMSSDGSFVLVRDYLSAVTNSDATKSDNFRLINGASSKLLLDGTAHWNQCGTNLAMSPSGKFVAIECLAAYPLNTPSKLSSVVVYNTSTNTFTYLGNDRLAPLGLVNSPVAAPELIGMNESGISFIADVLNSNSRVLVNYTFSTDSLAIVSALGDLTKTKIGQTLLVGLGPIQVMGALNEVMGYVQPDSSDATKNIYYILKP